MGGLLAAGWYGVTHETPAFLPHRTCYLNDTQVIWMHVISDAAIGLAYIAISSTLAYLVLQARREMPFHWIMIAFATFIIACAATHIMEVWTVWVPRYWLAGYVKVITAVASVATAIILPPLIPKIMALLSAARLAAERKVEIETANAELSSLYEKVKQLDQLKTNFFANVSHEFRTPLTLILGPIDRLISQPDLPDRVRQVLASIRRNGLILHKHVNDLLDISKLEAGKMELAYTNIDLCRMGRMMGAYFDTLARDRLVNFNVAAQGNVLVHADPDKLQRVIMNLLSNALKFVPEGGEVRCTVEQNDGRATITIEDSGPGIAPDLRTTVFERFHQGDSGTTRRYGGTGLGLSIVKEFVEMHHGTVTVDDSALGGAKFTVIIPVRAPDGVPVGESASESFGAVHLAEQNVAALRGDMARKDPADESEWARDQQLRLDIPAGDAPQNGDSPLILIVEDNVEMNEFISQILRAEYRTACAFNGREGFDKAIRLRPTVILTDMMMPEMSGEALISRLRAHPLLSGTPIILLTARADDELRMNMLRTGARDYVTKPFVVDELRARVRNQVVEARVRDTLQHELASQTEDLTELAQEITIRTRELQGAKEAAEAANEAKDRFLAVLSHELRTPLTPVLAAVINLESEPSLRPELRPTLEMIRRNIELESRLIDDLLDLTRVTRGKLQLNLEAVDVHELLRHAVQICVSAAAHKQLTVLQEFSATVSTVHADSGRLLQVIWNLIQNAVKFTPDHGRIEVRTRDGKERCIRIEIVDNGIGIEPEVMPKIFDAFEQGDTAISRRFGGLGLGLSVAKALVDAHGGTIMATSGGLDRGTTLVIEMLTTTDVPAGVKNPDVAVPPPKPLRILLVEDHEDTRTALTRLLARWGYAVETADSVKAAREKAEEGEFDILVSDLGLPDGTGLELMTALRARSNALLGIAISGFGMEQDVARSLEAGFSEHLTKPVAGRKLRDAIERIASGTPAKAGE